MPAAILPASKACSVIWPPTARAAVSEAYRTRLLFKRALALLPLRLSKLIAPFSARASGDACTVSPLPSSFTFAPPSAQKTLLLVSRWRYSGLICRSISKALLRGFTEMISPTANLRYNTTEPACTSGSVSAERLSVVVGISLRLFSCAFSRLAYSG